MVEIKKPNWGLKNDEMERINTYIELMENFLNLPGHEEFKALSRTSTSRLCATKSR